MDRSEVVALIREELARQRGATAGRAHRITDKDAGLFSFSANWINYGTGWDVAGWVKQGGIVQLFGLVTKTVAVALPDSILTLPTAIMPAPALAVGHICPAWGDLGAGRVDVVGNVVRVTSGGTAGGGGAGGARFLSLNGVWWPIG